MTPSRLTRFARPLAWPLVLVLGVAGITPTPAALAAASTTPATTRPAATRPATTRPGASALPGEAEIRAAFDRGEYAEVVKQADRVLRAKGKAAAAAASADADRHAINLLKAEAHLRLKQYKSAADAFGAAAKSTDDLVKAATARATQRTVTDAKGPRVQRRTFRPGEQPESADLLDPAQRADALRIARDELRAQAEPKVKAAMASDKIPAIGEALDLLWVKLDFEVATGGAVAEDQERRRQLADRARDLIEKEIARMGQDVETIWESASTIVAEQSDYNNARTTTSYRGLSNADRGDLRSVIATCDRIIPTVKNLARATGAEPPRDVGLMRQAYRVGQEARRVMNQNYRSQVSVQPPRPPLPGQTGQTGRGLR